ncbi:MAG: ABC transporter substrate-binding protein [Dehalococcoidia bacterium]
MGYTGSYWDRVTARRISRRRALQMAAITGASAGAIAIVGCGGGDDDDETTGGSTPGAGEGTPVPGGTFRGTVSLVLGKDPHKASTFLTHALGSYSYSRLMRYKTVLGELSQDEWYTTALEVAEKVENPDELTYIFTLRPDVRFHNLPPVNGRQLVAEDVVYSFNRYQEISPNKANMSMVESVTASADGTQVTFKLKEPFGLFLNRVASFQDLWIMPREFIEESETASEDRMLGSGPFHFGRFEPNVEMTWTKNPDYFEKDAAGNALPYLDGINLAIITDTNQVLSQFAAGTLDSISVPPTLLESVRGQSPDAIFDVAPRNILSFLYFEPASYTADKAPFNDERVRRAMSMAINRDALLNRISSEGGEWPNIPINAGFGESWWLDPKGSDIGDAGQYYQYNLTEAKALLTAALGGNGEFSTPMHFSSTVYTTIVPYYDVVRESLPALFREAGITVSEVPEEYGVYITKTFGRGEFDGFTFGLESVFSDIGLYWANMFYPRDAGGGRNHSSVGDVTLVDRIQKMLQLQDIDEIRQENFELQRYVSDKMYYVPVVTPVEFNARTPRLKGVTNITGPTTYALGTEVQLTNWFSA